MKRATPLSRRGSSKDLVMEALLLGPSLNDVFLGVVAETLDRVLLGYFRRAISDHRHLLGSGFFTVFDFERFETGQLLERRTDVLFATASGNAGHAGNVGDLLSHRRRGEGKDQQCDGSDECFHKRGECPPNGRCTQPTFTRIWWFLDGEIA